MYIATHLIMYDLYTTMYISSPQLLNVWYIHLAKYKNVNPCLHLRLDVFNVNCEM